MRHQPIEEPAGTGCGGGSAASPGTLASCDGRRLGKDELVAELADLEQRIQLLDPDEHGDVPRAMTQDLVEAQYTILRELRRRQQLPGRRLRWTVLRRRLGWAD